MYSFVIQNSDVISSTLHPFAGHAFAVRDDEAMVETVEGISRCSVLVPAIARPLEDGSYKLISGHRRKKLANERVLRR